MGMETLTREQQVFLEECNLEFSDRFTDADVDYKKVYDDGIPPPPVMYPWYGRTRSTASRNRAGGSRHNDNRGDYHDRNDREREHRDRSNESRNDRGYRDRYNDRRGVRYRPY